MQVTATSQHERDNSETNQPLSGSEATKLDKIDSSQSFQSDQSRDVLSLIKNHWQKLVALVLWVLFIGLYVWYISINELTPLESVRQLIDLMRSSSYGPLIFILIYAFRPLIFFSATLLTIASGYLFGPLLGIMLTIVASNLSAMLAYMIGRYFGGNLLDDEKDGLIRRYAKRMRSNSFETVLIMRFVFIPYDLVNYLGGLLRIDWKAFLFATMIGAIPGTISFALFGASIQGEFGTELPTLNPVVLGVSFLLFLLSLGLSRYFRHREKVTVN
ncbi:TVP38/TMEM64 family protein [Chloroflexi bacterium TSY]|nr:TVP38/TMEM64 family protein [Chloroflexi bacterium TSY]